MTHIDEIAAIVARAKKEARDEGYAAGYKDAQEAIRAARDAIDAALNASPVSISADAAAPRAQMSATVSVAQTNAYPSDRAKRGARDEHVLAMFHASGRKMKQSHVVEQLRLDGDKASPSSVRVVLTRLIDQGHLTRDGKFYALAENSSDGEAASDLASTAAPSSDFKRRFTNGTALVDERAMIE